jgi:hypothetical protein
MTRARPSFLLWKQTSWCAEAARRDRSAAAFLLDEAIALDDRFEVAARILCPGRETAPTVH